MDTNVLMDREDPRVTPHPVADLVRVLHEHNVQIFVHPASIREARRDGNSDRSGIFQTKVRSYPVLSGLPSTPLEFAEAAGGVGSPNGEVDVALLFATSQDAAAFLITEDLGLVGRATRVGLGERVLTVRGALEYFSRLYGTRYPRAPAYLEVVPAYALDPADPIFRSIEQEYEGFEAWFRKIRQEGRMCVRVSGPENQIGALMILKPETGELLARPTLRRLKISTLKVSEAQAGLRLGELLLQYAFNYALGNGFNETYVEVFSIHEPMVTFLRSYGFRTIGNSARGEKVMMKEFGVGVDPEAFSPIDYVRAFYPRFRDDTEVGKFLVPVQPVFHSMLFPEFVLGRTQRTLDGFIGPTHAAGNAIRKAYVCNSNTRQVSPGDILLFYRSQDVRRVTHIGVVERAEVRTKLDQVLGLVGNRTVFPLKKLSELCARTALVILFWNAMALGADRTKAVELPPTVSSPQAISQITDWEYKLLTGSRA
ncbi:MAG TPA: hypothetical protein VFF67_06130 [Thermoplasmata archaeon]|nr:hypothetical protein [Thermoplasmata archaeon]